MQCGCCAETCELCDPEKDYTGNGMKAMEEEGEERIMLPREEVFGGGKRPWCRRCGCIDVFEGLTD